MSDIKTRHIIALLLENESGALSRVSGLFSARSYNIESLTVAPTDDSTLSRMTIVTYGTEDIVEQITKQLNKLVDVGRVQELTKVDFVEREMALIKLKVSNATKESLFKYVEIFRGKILDVGKEIIIIELTGTAKKIIDKSYDNKKMTTFISTFPINKPEYIVLVSLDEPKGINDDYHPYNTFGWTDAGWNSTRVVRNIIDRIGPILDTKTKYLPNENIIIKTSH